MADRGTHVHQLAGLTEAQRRAIQTVDRSILVSAAAGAGKTTVLAERCAALVCDLPEPQRCRINELLVVTFTDAAASEMRSRIAAAIRKRLDQQPASSYLREQLYLLDSASISTIHSFCKTLIQRWFPQAQVDPQAAVLGGDEAELLRREVLDAFFTELFAGQDDLGRAFQQLVDDYGNGNDREIIEIVLRVHEFTCSVPDPQGWLRDAVARLDPAAPASLLAQLPTAQRRRMGDELLMQIEYGESLAAMMNQRWPAARMHADAVSEHVLRLRAWHEQVSAGPDQAWESVAAQIRDFEFERAKARPRNLSEEEKATYDAAKDERDKSKKLFTDRLQKRTCAFTEAEYRDGLTRIAPYVHTLVELVSGFERRYQEAKAVQAAVDFNDLQRRALQLLSEERDTNCPLPVARQLQQQYRYVLVDEFQDIDPLQEAILRLVSREAADPPRGNLFAVGDVKQSIYRFRLAEPMLFSRRADLFAAGSAIGELIHLQDNFRSRPGVIEAINLIFAPLMRRSFGGSDYDQKAKLHAGAVFPAAVEPDAAGKKSRAQLFDRPAIELHLLEPITEQTRVPDEADQDDPDDTGSEDELAGIEREAYLIARRIRQWMGDNPKQVYWHVSDKPETPGGPPRARPLAYRDIVILLRSTPHKAGPIADVLRRMGVPVRVERNDGGMDSTESRDLVSLLQVLDNQQQDIPLAAVLRSPLLGERFSETDLLNMRLLDREVPFHAAVELYAERGADTGLRDRLAVALATLHRYREQVRRTPVAEVLWSVYQESNYLAYVAGLPDSARRREHLLRLHELARQFGRFSRQGLHRFLRFIDQLLKQDGIPRQPSTVGAGENVVRIMTVHTSKGLEFPVVFLADLSKKFNLEDLRGPVLLDRELGIAMQATDPERRIRFPTFMSQLAEDHARRETLSEELRVLYVALTRAREHLVLVGRRDLGKLDLQRPDGTAATDDRRRLPRLQLEGASNWLDWVVAALSTAPGGAVEWADARADAAPGLFKVFTYDRATTDPWRIPPAVRQERAATLAQFADLQPLPPEEQVVGTGEAQRIVDQLAARYPALELTTLPARVAASELKRRWDAGLDPDERVSAILGHTVSPATSCGAGVSPARAAGMAAPPRKGPGEPAQPAFAAAAPPDLSLRRGTATHRFLQLVDLTRPCDVADLDRQLHEVTDAGRLSRGDADVVILDAVAWFLDSELGRHLRDHRSDAFREVPFVSRIGPEQYDRSVAGRDRRDVLLVRGIIDVIIRQPAGLEILDYKTDLVSPEACATRAAEYRTQMSIYSTAAQAIYRRAVTGRWLVFLHPRRIVDVDPH